MREACQPEPSALYQSPELAAQRAAVLRVWDSRLAQLWAGLEQGSLVVVIAGQGDTLYTRYLQVRAAAVWQGLPELDCISWLAGWLAGCMPSSFALLPVHITFRSVVLGCTSMRSECARTCTPCLHTELHPKLYDCIKGALPQRDRCRDSSSLHGLLPWQEQKYRRQQGLDGMPAWTPACEEVLARANMQAVRGLCFAAVK